MNKLEDYVGQVPTYCAAIRLTLNRFSCKSANQLLPPWATYSPFLVLPSLLVFECPELPSVPYRFAT